MEDKKQKIRLQESIRKTIEVVCEDICDNYCKYRDTCDENALCEITRNDGECPLDRLL